MTQGVSQGSKTHALFPRGDAEKGVFDAQHWLYSERTQEEAKIRRRCFLFSQLSLSTGAQELSYIIIRMPFRGSYFFSFSGLFYGMENF